MVRIRVVVISACLVLAYAHVAAAQGGGADSVPRATRRLMDSVDEPARLRWNSDCPIYSDFWTPLILGCQLSDVATPIVHDSVRTLSFQHLASPFILGGPPRRVESADAVDSIPIVVGDWHGLIEAYRASGRKNVDFVLSSADALGSPRAALMLRCHGGALEASLESPRSFGPPRAHTVTVLFGAEPPQTQRWAYGRDSTTLVVDGGQHKVQAFVHMLGRSPRLTIDVARPRPAPPSVFAFDLDGIPVVVGQLESACK
jgi:hypothetical protein